MTQATQERVALPVGTQTTYANTAGRIVAWREDNGYHDSYFHSLVAFDAEDGGYTFGWVQTGATAYGGGYIGRPNVTDQGILEAYAAKRAEVLAGLAADRAAAAEKTVEVGKAVTIVKPTTRGKNKTEAGATGEVVRKVEDAYRGSRFADYAGVKFYRVAVLLDEDGDARTVWLDEDRVRVTGHEGEDLSVSMTSVDRLIAQSWPQAQPAQAGTAW